MIVLAYIDPGLGALIWQTMVAAFVGLLFYLKKTRHWIAGVLRKVFRRAQKSPDVVPRAPVAEKVEIKPDVP